MATLGSKSVGSIVKLNMNNVAVDFIVVQSGNPDPSIYDASCDGTWLLTKDAKTFSSYRPYFENIDPSIKKFIKTVTLPYYNFSSGSISSITYEGQFILSVAEFGFKDIAADGTTLSYFQNGSSYSKGGCSGPTRTRSKSKTYVVTSSGELTLMDTSGTTNHRYAIILPSSLFVSNDGLIRVNTAPTPPSSITVPTTIIGGQNITVSWGSSTDADGNLSGYILERKADSGAWMQVYKGSSRSTTVPITYGWNSVQFRVKAYDSEGAESSYKTSDTRTVTNNRAPVISGSNSNLGSFSETAPSYSYTVTDADGNAVTVVETLDGVNQRTYTVTLGAQNTFTLDSDAWRKVLNGSHTLTIKATDPKNASATRTMTFTKSVTSISFEQTVAMSADDMPMKAMLNIQGSFPVGSILKVEICNNGNDAEPTWEDVTTRVLNGQKCYFSNTEKTAESWGVKIRVNLSRGTATEPCYIQTLGGNFG